MTARLYQDELYLQFKESESHNEDDIDEQQSHNEDDTEKDPSSSADDDSQAVPNVIAIANKDMKEMRKIHRLSSTPHPGKINQKKKTRNQQTGIFLTGTTCLPILNGSLIANDKVQRTFSLKGKIAQI